jgi:hypothetical protein
MNVIAENSWPLALITDYRSPIASFKAIASF